MAGMDDRVKITVGVAAAAYLAYRAARWVWAKDAANSAAKGRVPYGRWTKRQIAQYTGEDGAPILIALDGKVYDVSDGRGFYGPGGAYSVFAGRDASRLLATQSFDEGVTETELNAPIDPLDDLAGEDREGLDAYVGLFSVKYHCVGVLVEPTASPDGAEK